MLFIIWTLVGLYWVGVAVNVYINKSESRKARRTRITETIGFAIYDAVEWVRVKIFRRDPYLPPLSLSEANGRTDVRNFFDAHGIRYVTDVEDNGNVTHRVNPEDAPKLMAIVTELERQYGFTEAVRPHEGPDLSKT